MSSKLMKGKARYTRRRLAIIFMLCTIIAVSLMTGFSGLNSDNTKHSAIGQRICMFEDAPEDGTTPEDHDLISNVKYTAQRLYMSRYFRGETSGTVEAELGAGLSYNQNVYNTRVVKGDKIFTESISSSWAKSVGEQKYIDGTRVLLRPSTSVSGKTAKFANSVQDITETYGELYGLIPNELTKQVLSVTIDPEKDYGVTIKSVRDDNAGAAKAASLSSARSAESDGGEDEPDEAYEAIDFEVPQSLTPDKDGNFKFTLTLDPVGATLYSRNETRTLAGSPRNPDYSSESSGSVVVTIVIDSNWYPISVNVRETYGIEIPGIGALICNSNLTEKFSEIGNKDIVLPEQEFFESHMNDIGGGDITPAEPEAADYLMYAFGKYISGAENLDLSANISVGNVDIKNVKLSVNIGTMNIRARYGDLTIEYAKGDAVGKPQDDLVYITLNDIKGYLPVSKATGLISDPEIKSLMSMFASDIALPDFGSIIGNDFMSSMTCEKTDDYVYINIPLNIDGLAEIDAKMTLKNNATYDLVGISGTVKAFGQTIVLDIKTAKNLEFETVDSSYVDLSPVVDFVPAAISTVLDNTVYGISGAVKVNGTEVALDAYIERDGFKNVAADATVSIFGVDVGVQYVNDALYAMVGNVGVKATTADIPALIQTLGGYIGTDSGALDKVKAFLPQTPADWIGIVQSLTADEHEAKLVVRILGAPITVTLSRDGNTLTGFAIKTNINKLGIKLDLDVALDITLPEHRDIAIKDIEYIDAKDIADIIPYVVEYANAKALDVTLDGKITIDNVDVALDGVRLGIALSDGTAISASGRITALDQDIDIAYVGDTAYVSLGGIKLKIAIADAKAFVPQIKRLFGIFGINIDASVGTIDVANIVPEVLDAVQSVTLENNVITLKAALGDGGLQISANAATGKISISGEISKVKLALDGTLTACLPEQIDIAVEAPETYSDLAELLPTVDTVTDIIEAKAATAKFNVSYGGYEFGGTLAIDLNGGFKLALDLDKITGKYIPNVTLGLTVIDSTAYVKVDGNVTAAISASTDDANAIVQSLASVIPSDINALIEKILDALSDPKGEIKTLISSGETPSLESVRTILDSVLSSITLSVAEGNIDLTVNVNDVAVTAKVAADLSSAAVDAAFGKNEISARLYNISSGAAISIPDCDFLPISKFIPAIDAVMPIVNAQGYAFDVNVTLFGVTVKGAVKISLPTEENPIAVSADVMIGDVPLSLAYKDDVIYLDIDKGGIMFKCGTTAAELDSLLKELTEAIPALQTALDGLTSETQGKITLDNILKAKLALTNTENGFGAKIDLAPVGFDAQIELGISLADGKLDGIAIDVAARTSDEKADNDIVLDIDLNVELDESGAIRAIRTIDGAKYAVAIEIKSLAEQTISVSNANGYVALADLTEYVAPIAKLVENIDAVKSLSFGINADVLTDNYKRLSISGMVEIDLEPIAVRVKLDLFDETIEITYVKGVLYIKLGAMHLKFTVSNGTGTNDIERIYYILDEHLPDYLSEELAIMFGVEKGTSSLGDLGLIIDRLKAFASAKTITEKAALLFDKLHNYDDAKSTVKALADMVILFMRDGAPAIGFAATDDITINISPVLTKDRTELAEISVDTAVSGMNVLASIGAPALSENSLGIAAPEYAESCVSLIDYVELINNIYHTFTTKNADGDITFVINTFDFTYAEKDTTVEKADGTTEVVKGGTVSVTNATDENGNDIPVLKGKFAKNAQGKYDVNLEAHVTLSGLSEYGGDLTLALYVLTNYEYVVDKGLETETTTLYDQVAFLTYRESETGYGENISIDYGSVMQILASALKILGVKPETVNEIIPAEYRVNIDSGVFSSLEIGGLDMAKIRTTLDDIVGYYISAKKALGDLGKAWKLIEAPDDLKDPETEEPLPREDKIDALLASTEDIKTHIQHAIGRFTNPDYDPDKETEEDEEDTVENDGGESATEPENGEIDTTEGDNSDGENDEEEQPVITEITVPEFSDIVNGISLTSVNGDLGATVSNKLTTKGEGIATLGVAQTEAGDKTVVDGISIDNLDVNKALINADVDFDAGVEVKIAPDMDSLINVTDAKDKTTYSDLSNIKHLLFDVLNTANLLEFDIGGVDTDDTITLNINLGDKAESGSNLLSVNIHYAAKVKLFDKDERLALGWITKEQYNDENEPDYKTAAFVELKYKDCKAHLGQIVGDLSTRLYFYENTIYVDGVKSWSKKELSYGGFLGIGATTKTFWNCERVYVKYTVDEFFYMISNGLKTSFLPEFLFYLVPLNTSFQDWFTLGIPINLQDIITSAIPDTSTEENKDTATPDKTIAKVFKGYTYETDDSGAGTHEITIGLSELANNSSLSDIDVKLTGANNSNDEGTNANLHDNYVSAASVGTSFVSVVKLSLTATLRNADDTNPDKLVSKGLGGVSVYNDHWYLNNKQFIFDGYDVTYASLGELLNGELAAYDWQPIWTSAYQAAKAKEHAETAKSSAEAAAKYAEEAQGSEAVLTAANKAAEEYAKAEAAAQAAQEAADSAAAAKKNGDTATFLAETENVVKASKQAEEAALAAAKAAKDAETALKKLQAAA